MPESAVGIKTLVSKSVRAYPNPANDFITFDLGNEDVVNIEIYNQTGKLVKNINSYQNNNKINISSLPTGLYFCKLTNNKSSNIVKIVISK